MIALIFTVIVHTIFTVILVCMHVYFVLTYILSIVHKTMVYNCMPMHKQILSRNCCRFIYYKAVFTDVYLILLQICDIYVLSMLFVFHKTPVKKLSRKICC